MFLYSHNDCPCMNSYFHFCDGLCSPLQNISLIKLMVVRKLISWFENTKTWRKTQRFIASRLYIFSHCFNGIQTHSSQRFTFFIFITMESRRLHSHVLPVPLSTCLYGSGIVQDLKHLQIHQLRLWFHWDEYQCSMPQTWFVARTWCCHWLPLQPKKRNSIYT